jgi:hypothetical protein
MVCPTKVSEKAGHFQGGVDRKPASTLLAEKEKPGGYPGGDHESFAFTWIELFAK